MKNSHIVKSFDDDLLKIENMISAMGGLVESQIAAASQVLVQRNVEQGRMVIEQDKQIDAIEFEVGAAVVKILALRQPKAQDLRAALVALKIAGNLERIGDYAKNICKRTQVLATTPPVGNSIAAISRMGNMVQQMIKDVLDAYGARDMDRADDVRQRDQQVDRMHNALFSQLLGQMMENKHDITACMHLLFIAKNLERMGDHVTAIAEQVHFLVSGEMPKDDRPKDDTTSYSSAGITIDAGAGQ